MCLYTLSFLGRQRESFFCCSYLSISSQFTLRCVCKPSSPFRLCLRVCLVVGADIQVYVDSSTFLSRSPRMTETMTRQSSFPPAYIFVFLSTDTPFLSVHLSLYRSRFLFLRLSIYLSVHLSVCLLPCLSMYLSGVDDSMNPSSTLLLSICLFSLTFLCVSSSFSYGCMRSVSSPSMAR